MAETLNIGRRRRTEPSNAGPDHARLVRLAVAIFAFADDIGAAQRGAERQLVEQSGKLLDGFAARAEAEGLMARGIAPARYALAVLLDQAARRNPRLSMSSWAAAAHTRLFDGRDMSLERVREFRQTAGEAGAGYAPLIGLFDEILHRAERGRHERGAGVGSWTLRILAGVAVFLAALASYAGFLEYRFHSRLWTEFERDALSIGLDRPQHGAELAERLDRLAASVARVGRASSAAPLGGVVPLPGFDSGGRARDAYLAAVGSQLPATLAGMLDEALATEGDGLQLYDTLRAWSVLSGDAEWAPAYLAGWLEDHGAASGLAGLARHVEALDGPVEDLRPGDAELARQARGFAAEADEGARAWLELLRSAEARALAPWRPDHEIPGLADVLVRRSGLPVTASIPGIFTAAGWDFARDFGTGVAVQRAREVAPELLGVSPERSNDTPDRLMDRLQADTIAYWQDWLADLRVRPFDNRSAAILVSGSLAQRSSPLTELLRRVWAEVGGNDRRRSHAKQLRLATAFGPMIQYVEQGRMEEIAGLFSALNVALGAIDVDEKRGTDRLMSVQDRARSIAALKSAPLIVVQITEDVLAQTGAAEAGQGASALTLHWQRNVFPVCRDALAGRYPFADGPDADPGAVAGLLGPDGTLLRFFAVNLQHLVDSDVNPWRWKPEARFAGLTPESAVFFQRAQTLSASLFEAPETLGTTLSLATLAERGQALMALGGVAVPLRAAGEPAALAWPGPEPALGAEVTFRDDTASARLAEPGPWGLLRLLDSMRVRPRDEGQRLLVDMRTDRGRIFVEMRFSGRANPVSARGLMRQFACPPTL